MQYIVLSKRWRYTGHINLRNFYIGYHIKDKNSCYNGCDISETDPYYRLFMMGYAVFESGSVRLVYKRDEHLIKTMQGRCCCCFNACEQEVCYACDSGIARCNIIVL